MPGLAPHMDVLFWVRNKFLDQGYTWNRHLGSFFGRYGDLFKQYKVSLSQNVKWHSVTWPFTMTNPYWSDFVPNSTFYRILRGFPRIFATGVACPEGTFTPPDTLSRPFGTYICSTCWDQSFFRTCRYFSGICSSNIPRYFLGFASSGSWVWG